MNMCIKWYYNINAYTLPDTKAGLDIIILDKFKPSRKILYHYNILVVRYVDEKKLWKFFHFQIPHCVDVFTAQISSVAVESLH